MMRSLFILTAAVLLLAGCKQKLHRVRFQNQFSSMITAVKAGPVDFGNVAAGEITGYKEIPEGEHQLQGNNPIGFIQGSFTIQGKGVHAWTLILKADRNIELVQEE